MRRQISLTSVSGALAPEVRKIVRRKVDQIEERVVAQVLRERSSQSHLYLGFVPKSSVIEFRDCGQPRGRW